MNLVVAVDLDVRQQTKPKKKNMLITVKEVELNSYKPITSRFLSSSQAKVSPILNLLTKIVNCNPW